MTGNSESRLGATDPLQQAVTLARSYWMWLAVGAIGTVAFFGSPGDYTGTSRAILHGLCAQTPSHTFTFGGKMLPFDARMTGIYGGFLVTIVTLAAGRKLFMYGNPPKRIVALLAALVAVMAIDGFNSLFTDLGLWHPYVPTNTMRVVTGYGVGITLAVGLAWLLASSTWNLSTPRTAISRAGDLWIPAAGLVVYGTILAIRPAWLHFPVSMMLVIAAWATVTLLALVMLLLALKLDATIRSPRDLHVPGAIGALLAMSAMLGLAGGRFWMEHWFGISNAMM